MVSNLVSDYSFWKAISQVCPDSRWQRCWVHKTANVLNKLPKSIQPKAKEKLHKIWHADTADGADGHFDNFIQVYGAKFSESRTVLKKGSGGPVDLL